MMYAATLAMALAACSPGATHRSVGLQSYAPYWNTAVADLASVSVASNYAAMALVDGDQQRASQLLDYAQRQADAASASTSTSVPATWRSDGVAARLDRAAELLLNAVSALRLDVVRDDRAKLTEAQDDRQRAMVDLVDAAATAKKSYARMGGRPSDLESIQSATQHTLSTLDSMVGHDNDDD
jgi:hypothetical protein